MLYLYFISTCYTCIFNMLYLLQTGARPRFALTNSEIKLIASDVDRHQRLRYAVTGTIGTRYFTVDADSGVVKLREPFDREVSKCIFNACTAWFS